MRGDPAASGTMRPDAAGQAVCDAIASPLSSVALLEAEGVSLVQQAVTADREAQRSPRRIRK